MASAFGASLDPEKVFVTKIFGVTSFGVRMKKQDLQNERLDEIGLRLLDAARLRRDEIDEVAAAPHLFDAVRKQIDTEKSGREARFRWTAYRPDWRTGLTSVAVAAVLLIGAGVFMFVPEKVPDNVFVQQDLIRPANVIEPPTVRPVNVAATLAAKPHSHEIIPARYAANKKKPQRPQREEMSEFYALTYDDDTNDDLQIVRVELPRTSLLAMGLSSHAENESDKVKADLLIGSDGVTRAVRFAK